MLYTLHNRTKHQINVNLDGTEDPKTTVVVPPQKIKKVDMTQSQYQHVKNNYKKEIVAKKLTSK